MLTDTFINRYQDPLWIASDAPQWLNPFCVRLSQLFRQDILAQISDREAFSSGVAQQLTRELGIRQLDEGQTWEDVCVRYLSLPYNLWNDAHQTPDYFLKSRLSFLELALRRVQVQVENLESIDKSLGDLLSWTAGAKEGEHPHPLPKRAAYDAIVHEFNTRLRNVGLPFSFDRGYLLLLDDPLTSSAIEAPFWPLLIDPMWANVALDMKEAMERRDSGGRDSALYAMKALESTIKIICENRGLTRGNEKGASNFIDNLVSSKNGRFLAPWEGELLTGLFRMIRNPLGHGSGSAAPPVLTRNQETWAIESAMSWIKSLVRRL